MDKKLQLSRQRQGLSKPKAHPPRDLIALGTSTRPDTPENFPSGAGKSSVSSVKRDLTGIGGLSGSSLPPKKARLVGDYTGTGGGLRPGAAGSSGAGAPAAPVVSRKDPTNDTLWQNLATSEVVASELLAKIKTAEERLKTSRIPKYLCSAVKLISEKRNKPIDPVICVALGYLVNHNPVYFQDPPVIEAFCSLLKRQSVIAGTGKIGKQENFHAVFVCNLLLKAFIGVETWPATFVRVYLDDCLTDRSWVDRKECQAFVKNILTAFGTERAPPEFLISLNFGELAPPTLQATPTTPPVGTSTPEFGSPTSGADSSATFGSREEQDSRDSAEMEILGEKMGEEEKQLAGISVKNRYESNALEVRDYAVQLLQDWWSRRLDITPKNLLRTMSACCGLIEVRQAGAQKLDTWLQNTKLQKVALELLMTVCINSRAPRSQPDLDVLSGLTRIRGLKNKPVLNIYFSALKELFGRQKGNLTAVMKLVLHNELSPAARAPNNMLILHQCFQFDSDKASEVLGDIFAEFLMEREDFLKALRLVLRDLARSVLRNEFPMLKLGSGILTAITRQHQTVAFDVLHDRTFMSLVDLVCLIVFLGVTPAVKEAAQSRKAIQESKQRHILPDKFTFSTWFYQTLQHDVSVMRKYQRDVGELLRICVDFMQKHASDLFTPTEKIFTSALFRFLFMDKTDFYTSKDNWPSEQEKNVMMRMINDAPLCEETLLNVLSMGLSEKHPITLSDSMELADAIVRRAAFGHAEDQATLVVSNITLIDLLFNSCVFHVPKNIILPSDYQLPLMAVTLSYWKALVILVVISAYNPVAIGNLVWSVYPTCRYLMEMVMIQEYTFPPVTSASEEKSLDALKAEDVQELELEKHKIIDLENFLASLSTKVAITEHNSHLLSKVMDLNPKGPGRRPPDYILELLKSLNQQLSLGMLLCKSRSPDFLLQIINRQGASSSSPWLIRLIESNEGSLDVLPVQCLCEFYLHQLAASGIQKSDLPGLAGAVGSQSVTRSVSLEADLMSLGQSASSSEKRAGSSGQLTKKEKQKKEQEELNEAAKAQRIEEMKRKLSEILWGENETVEAVEQALMYFLNRLQAETLKERNTAWRALDELLKKSVIDGSTEVDEPPGEENWLFGRLPTIPKFPRVKKRVCDMLRKSCLVETNIERLCSHVKFAVENSASESPKHLAEDFGQMIVDRQLLMKNLFPSIGVWPELNREVFCILMKTFQRYLKSIRENQEELIQWSTNQNEIIVEWSKDKGESAIIRVTVVHAMIILLCYPQSALEGDPKAQEAAEYIESVWFPTQGVAPRAYLVDTTEDAELTPDWLKARMLQSENNRLVDSALANLDWAQILMFLQMFGLPVASVNKLLALLDAACEKAEVIESLGSGVFLGCAVQFVKAHRARGCTGGNMFLSFFDKEPKLEDEKMEVSTVNIVTPLELKRKFSTSAIEILGEEKSYEWKSVVPELLDPNSESSNSESTEKWRSLIRELNATAPKNEAALQACLDWLKFEKGVKLWQRTLENKSMRLCGLIGAMNNLNIERVNVELTSLGRYLSGNKDLTLPLSLKKILERFPGTTIQEKRMETSPSRVKSRILSGNLKSPPKSLSLENRERDVKAVLERMKSVETQESKMMGNLLDELVSLDPDLVKVCPDEELSAIFGRNGITGQKHVLNSLPHKVRLPVLSTLVGKLLKACDTRLNPSLVLDFVWACGNLPQVCRGRDKNLPRHHKMEDVLGLSGGQLTSLVDYVVEESADLRPRIDPAAENNEEIGDLDGELDWSPLGLGTSKESKRECREETVKERVELILICVAENGEKLKKVVERVLERCEGERRDQTEQRRAAQLLLLELYLARSDAVGDIVPKTAVNTVRTAVHAGSSKFDALLHLMIVDLFRLADSPKTDKQMQRLNLALNKLATVHPTLVLRQLSLMAALTRGLSDWTMRKYYGSNVLQLLKDVLALMHLLKPAVFDRHYAGPFQDLLNTYFDFIKNHGLRNPKLVFYVDSTLDLLEAYHAADSEAAGKFLEKTANVLQIIQMRYPELPHGKSLISQLAMPLSGAELQQAAAEAQEAMGANYELNPTPVRPPSPVGNQQARNLLLRLEQAKRQSREELLAVLKEIEDVSQRKPDCLQYFKGELECLMTHWDSGCRRLALGMTAKYLKEKGGKNEGILESYLLCLTHSDAEIVTLALEFLGEFVTIFRERSSLILRCAFRSEVTWDVETTKKVNEAIQSANLKWEFPL